MRISSISNLMEENQKDFNSLYLLSLNNSDYQYSEIEKDEIYSIALQCPLEGGFCMAGKSIVLDDYE